MRKTVALMGVFVFLAGCNTLATEPPAETGKIREQSNVATSSAEILGPLWKSGYTWQFRWESPHGRGTYVWTVKGEERVDGIDYYVIATDRQIETYRRKADLAFAMVKVDGEVDIRFTPPYLQYVWPLAPGKKWEQTVTREAPRDKRTDEISTTCQVEAEETIAVPAGSFRAFKIVCHNKLTGSLMSEVWYSPEAKQLIRDRVRFSYGIQERNLIDFKVK